MERRAISGAELAKLERLAALGRELCARLAVHLAKVQHQARECQPLMRVTYIQEAEALESLLLASGLKQVYDTQYQTLRAGWRLGEDLVIVPPVVDQRPEPQPAPAQVQPTSVPATPAASPAATTATSRAVKPSPEKVDSWASLRAKLDKGALLEARPPSSGDSLWPIGINSLQSASQLASKAPLYVRFKNFYYPVPQERWSEAYRIALLILMSKLTPEACVLCLQQNGFLMGSKVELYIKAPYRTPVLGVRPGLYLPIYNQPQQILANLRALSTALGKNPGDLSFYCLEAAASQPAPKAKTLPAAIAAANAANSTATTAKAGQGVVDVSNLDLSQTMISLGGGISVAPAAQPKTQSVPPARPTPPARSTLPTQSAPPIQSAPPAQAPPPGRSLPQVQPSPGAGGDPERELAEIMGLVGGYQGVMEEIKAPEKVESTTTARPKADLGSLRPTALGIGFDRVTVSPPTWPQLYVNFVRWLYEKKLASNVTALYRHEADWGIVVTASAAGMAKDHPGKAYIVLADCAYLLLESEPQRVVDTLSKCCRALGLRPQLYYAPREAAPQEGAWLLEEGLKIHLAPGLSPEEEPGVGEVKAAPPSGPRWLQIGGEGIEITPPSWAELLHRFVGWLLVHTSLGERPLEDLYNRCHLALTRSSAEMEGRYPGHKYVAIDSDLYLLLYEDQASVLDAIKACARYLGISFERIAISNHLPQPAPTPAAPVESSPPVDSVVDASIKEAEPEFETEPAMESEPVSEMASEVEAEPEVWPEVEADVEPAAEVDPGLEPEPAPEAEPILEAKPAPTEAPLAQVAAADRQPFYLTPFNLVTDFEGYLPIAWECEGKFHLGEELSQPSWSAWQVSLVSQLLEELDPWRLVKLLERVEIPLKWRVDFWREASSEPHVVIGERVFVGREDYKWSIKAFRPLFKHLGIDLRQVKIYLYPASQIADYLTYTTIGEVEPEVGLAEEVEAEVVPEVASEVEPEEEVEFEQEVVPAEEVEIEPAAEVDPRLEPEPVSEAVNELEVQPGPTNGPLAPDAVHRLESQPAPEKGPLVREKLEPVRCRAASLGPLGEALRQVALEQSGGILMGDRLGYKKFLYKVRANYGGHAQQGALLALSEEGYRDLLERCGLPLESEEGVSYYFYYPQLEKRLEKILEEARQRDWRVFNLERLGARHNLEELNLRQVELWPSLLERLNLPGRLITKTTKGQKEYFYTLEPQEKNLERLLLGEVRAHWGGESLLTLPQLQERLPYLGEADIKLAIGKGEELVLNETSTASRCASYLNLNYFELPPEEVERILEQVKTDLQKNGVFNLRDLPIDDLRYLADSRMTDIGWQNAIYVKYLSAACQRQGSTFFISWHGEKTVFSGTVLEGRFRTVDGIVKYSQLVEWTKELTGKTFPESTQKAAYNVLVRLDKDNWAADKEVDFCVEEIDSILEQKIGLFSSLKMLPSDLLYILPSCGHPWSLSLIESFCHRFSKKFRLLVPNGSCYNSQNIGIIAQASCDANYDELVIQALQKGGVGHNLQEIRDFLEEGGYFGTVYDATLKRFFGVV